MAVSRPLLLVLLGLVLATATLFAARGASQGAADPLSSAVVPAPTPAPTPVSPGDKGRDPVGPASKEDKARDHGAKPKDEKAAVPARERDKPARPARKRDKPSRAARKTQVALPAGVPAEVGRALRDRQIVVLFFGQGGADDVATGDAVASLRGLKRVAVFTDGIQNLAKYPGIVSGLGVAQAPAIVIVGTERRARLIEGYVDPGTLRQQVVDAR